MSHFKFLRNKLKTVPVEQVILLYNLEKVDIVFTLLNRLSQEMDRFRLCNSEKLALQSWPFF